MKLVELIKAKSKLMKIYIILFMILYFIAFFHGLFVTYFIAKDGAGFCEFILHRQCSTIGTFAFTIFVVPWLYYFILFQISILHMFSQGIFFEKSLGIIPYLIFVFYLSIPLTLLVKKIKK
jgi:hypothetical protein